MGTRSLVKFQEDHEDICTIYQQFDGYLDGVGRELYDFLQDTNMVNGISAGQEGMVANGMGCLAAQFVAAHKDGAGGFYMHPNSAGDEEYVYLVNSNWDDSGGFLGKPGPLQVVVRDHGETVFEGSVQEFGRFLDSDHEDDE